MSMSVDCSDEGGIWSESQAGSPNRSVCLCPNLAISANAPELLLFGQISLFCVLAFTIAFQIYLHYLMFKRARGVKVQMRRMSELASENHLTIATTGLGLVPGLGHTRHSSNQLDFRRESEFSRGSRLSSNAGGTAHIEDMYEQILPQYVIQPIHEESGHGHGHGHSDLAAGGFFSVASELTLPSMPHHQQDSWALERSDSVNSGHDAEQLFRLIFQDPSGGDGAKRRSSESRKRSSFSHTNKLIHDDYHSDKDTHESDGGRMSTKLKFVSTLSRVRDSIWSRGNGSRLNSEAGSSTDSLQKHLKKRKKRLEEKTSADSDGWLVKKKRHQQQQQQQLQQHPRRSSDFHFGPANDPRGKGHQKRNRSFQGVEDLPPRSRLTQRRHTSTEFNPPAPIASRMGSHPNNSMSATEARLIQARQRRRVAVSFHNSVQDGPRASGKNPNQLSSISSRGEDEWKSERQEEENEETKL